MHKTNVCALPLKRETMWLHNERKKKLLPKWPRIELFRFMTNFDVYLLFVRIFLNTSWAMLFMYNIYLHVEAKRETLICALAFENNICFFNITFLHRSALKPRLSYCCAKHVQSLFFCERNSNSSSDFKLRREQKSLAFRQKREKREFLQSRRSGGVENTRYREN